MILLLNGIIVMTIPTPGLEIHISITQLCLLLLSWINWLQCFCHFVLQLPNAIINRILETVKCVNVLFIKGHISGNKLCFLACVQPAAEVKPRK